MPIGYLVISHCDPKHHGTMGIYAHNGLKLADGGEGSLECSLTDAMAWDGLYEHYALPAEVKRLPVARRPDRKTYIPREMVDLDIFPMGEGRFLFAPAPRTTKSGLITTSVVYEMGGSTTMFENLVDLSDFIPEELVRLGIDRTKVWTIQSYITNRITMGLP